MNQFIRNFNAGDDDDTLWLVVVHALTFTGIGCCSAVQLFSCFVQLQSFTSGMILLINSSGESIQIALFGPTLKEYGF